MSHTLLPLLLGAALAACNAPGVAQGDPSAQAAPSAPTKLDLEKCFELSTKLRLPGGLFQGWMSDGKSYLANDKLEGGEKKQLVLVEVASGKKRALYDVKQLEAALAALPGISKDTASDWSADTGHQLSSSKDALLINAGGDLFCWYFGESSAARLTSGPAEEVGESFSPDGKLVAYVRDYNLWLAPAGGGAERALTTEGDENHLYGRLDWVYQEEVYGRGNFGAYWWSPDSSKLAFLVLDETEVPTYTIVDERSTHPKLEEWRYPKAGDPNPKVRLAVVDAAGGAARYIDLSGYSPEDLLIVRVDWTPDSKEVLFQAQNRIQTWLDLCAGDARSGKLRKLFRDSTSVWIEPVDGLSWLADGEQFVWPSERDGWRHLYLYKEDGTLVRRLTEGQWEVDNLLGVDEKGGQVWLSGDRADVKGQQLLRVPLAGGEATQVTKSGGTHSVQLAPDFAHYYASWSSISDPGSSGLYKADGTCLRVLATVDRKPADEAGLRAPDFVRVKTRDGFEMEAVMLKPASFDASKKYPVICHTYSGPHAPQVTDRWGGFNSIWHQWLAQQGYLVWICDNRSASGKGLASCTGVYRDFGTQELADLLDGLDWLCAQPYVDRERVALWGWSYGGYMTAFALTHSQRFKCGIAGSPVTDWRFYDSIYTERYMGLPRDNEAGYERGSVLESAKELSGKLLIVYGTLDENVHPQNSLRLARALQQADKSFEMMAYPGNRHGVSDSKQRRHLYSLMTQFLRDNL